VIAARGGHARRRLLPRISVRGLAIALLVVVLLGCAWLWFRDSSLVAIRHVRVTGLSGPGVPQIRHDLTSAAKLMTTLDVDVTRLDNSVSQFPDVRALHVTTHFPHSVDIAVIEQVPVATVEGGGGQVVVDSSGELLSHPQDPPQPLPTVPLRGPAGGGRVTAPGARAALAALAAAPYTLITHIENATSTAAHGVIVQLRNGPQIYFGSTLQLAAKWASALAVLSDSSSAGADYIDVSDPRRPAAGAN
jgi:cell division protein FtsQ